MKKIIFSTIIILFTINLLGQTTTGPQNTVLSFLPNVTPPSPQAFSITEYGNLGASEYRGKPSISIPLYTYKAGNLSLSMTLNNNSAGVKVNDLASWTGMGWVLNAGGVITRTVKDLPDEGISSGNNYQRIVLTDEDALKNSTSTNCSPNSEYFFNLCYHNDQFDTENDVFRFNFEGYSGSFILDENNNPLKLNNDNELKIEILNNNLLTSKTIIITTPSGVKYYFGGNETENTKTASGGRMTLVFDATTSFYLYKIEHPINGTIFLEYKSLDSRSIFLSKNYSQTYFFIQTAMPYVGPSPNSSYFQTWINHPKYINRIYSVNNSEEINFVSTNYPNNQNVVNVLERINITNANSLIHGISFDYLYDSSLETTDRFFLERLEFNKDIDNTGSIKHEVYKMEYNDPLGLPERLSNSQDIEGYFNGKNNGSLLVRPMYMENYPYYADRMGDFSYASKGTLTKLYYPTGGYTLLEYECNGARKADRHTYDGNISFTGGPIPFINSDNSQLPRTVDDQVIFGNPIYQDQTAVISITTNSNPLDSYNHFLSAKLNVTEVETGLVSTFLKLFSSNTEKKFIYNFKKGNHYTFEISIDLSKIDQNYPVLLNASYKFDIIDGYSLIDGSGLRLKKQTDNDGINGSNIKRYYYNRIGFNSYDPNLVDIDFEPKYTFSYNNATSSIQKTIYSDVTNKYCKSNEFENSFEYVTISLGGDNFEKGGIEKEFYDVTNLGAVKLDTSISGTCVPSLPFINGQGQIEYPPADAMVCYNAFHSPVPTDISIIREIINSTEETEFNTYNGTLMEENNFTNINGDLYKVKSTNYDNLPVILSRRINFVGYNLFPSNNLPVYCPNQDGTYTTKSPLSNCYKGYYLNLEMTNPIRRVINNEFIEPVPLSIYLANYDSYGNEILDTRDLENPFRKIQTLQTFNYGLLRGLPTEITTTTSENGIVDRTVNKYANDISVTHTLPFLTNDQIYANQQLVAMNNIASPVQVEKYKGQNLLSTQRTIYRQVDPNKINSILPSLIQTSKGAADLEDRAEFVEYDSKGNLSIARLSNGSQIKYYYNDYNQVIVKIENYSGGLNSFQNPLQNINPCDYQQQNPNSMISIYNYDTVTHQILSIVGPNCKTTFYEYNSLHQLVRIRDNENNILQEFDHNYKPQN